MYVIIYKSVTTNSKKYTADMHSIFRFDNVNCKLLTYAFKVTSAYA